MSVIVQVFGRRDDETDHALKRPATKNLHISGRAATFADALLWRAERYPPAAAPFRFYEYKP
jgi:hypothetical protein